MSTSPRTLRRRAAVAGAAVVALAAVVLFLVTPLNGNLRYEAGVKEVSPYGIAGTFSHRPLAFRLLAGGLFQVAHLLSWGLTSFELVVRVLALVLVLGAGVLLARGLTARGLPDPGWHAVVAVGALLFVSLDIVGEPDWMAAVLTVGAVGTALLRRRPWLWASLAGALFTAAAGMKILTVVTAVLGLAVVALVDRRQGVRTLLATVVAGTLYVLGTLVWVPWEVQWLLDIHSVQKDAVAALPDAVPFFWLLAATHPALLLLPAALLLAPALERVCTLLGVAAGLALVMVQGQYFVYHAVPLVVLATLAVFRAFRHRVGPVAAVVVLTVAVAASALTTRSTAWRDTHHGWQAALLAVVLLGVAWAVVRRLRPPGAGRGAAPGPGGVSLAAGLALALLIPATTPWSNHLLRPANPGGTRPPTVFQTRTSDEATARAVRRVVGGPDVEVTYLTFGEWTYFIRNPTACRYPSPLFLQRTRNTLDQVGRPSYEENLRCLSAPGSRWLVWETDWFSSKRLPPDVQQILRRQWQCDPEHRVVVGPLRLCPRR